MTGLLAAPFPLVLAGPSGAGKTTIARLLADRRDDVRFSVSATTRPARATEVDGRDYLFLSRERFERMQEEEGLLEWAEVHGHLYGTPRANLARAREMGVHLLLDIDVQGARSVRDLVPEAVTVFLLPPSGERIVERLRDRRTEDETVLRSRLRGAAAELLSIDEFDFVVVNDDLEEATSAVEGILATERRRVERLGRRASQRARELLDEIERALT